LQSGHRGLQTSIDPLVKSSLLKKDGLLIILTEESENDNTNGGSHVVATFISGAVSKPGYQSTTLYQHQSTLRLTLEGLGVKVLTRSCVKRAGHAGIAQHHAALVARGSRRSEVLRIEPKGPLACVPYSSDGEGMPALGQVPSKGQIGVRPGASSSQSS